MAEEPQGVQVAIGPPMSPDEEKAHKLSLAELHADEAEERVKLTAQTLKDLQASLKDKRAEAKALRAEHRRLKSEG